MQTDGYALHEALKQWGLRKEAAEKAFPGSLNKFKSEEKETPQQVMVAFIQAEDAIARLQVAQMRYNLGVGVQVQGEKMLLAEAIKRIGSAGRTEKMWKTASPSDRRRSSYMDDSLTRDPTQERAEATIDAKAVLSLVTQAGKKSGAFRAAIAVANGTKMEIEDLNPALFE